MTNLNRFAKSGKVHPLHVLVLVAARCKGAGSVKRLLNPATLGDDEFNGALGIAVCLLADQSVSDISLETQSEMFGRLVEDLRVLHDGIAGQTELAPILAQMRAALPPATRPARADPSTSRAAQGKKGRPVMPRATSDRKSPTTASSQERQAAMLAIIEEHGPISPGQLDAALKKCGMDLSKPTIHRDMEELMRAQGTRVTVSGSRQSRRYTVDGRTAAADATARPRPEARGARQAAPAATKSAAGARRGRRAAKEVPTASPKSVAMVPASAGAGMSSLVQAITGQGGGGENALMRLTDAGRQAVRTFVRGAAGGVVRDVDTLMEGDGPPDAETVERARGGLLFLNLMLEGVAAAPSAAKSGGSKPKK